MPELRPEHFYIACPICAAIKDCKRHTLHSKHTWRSVTCKHCKKHSSASKWKCSCGLQWRHCQTHRPQGFACGRNIRASATNAKPSFAKCPKRVGPLGAVQGQQRPALLSKAVHPRAGRPAPVCNRTSEKGLLIHRRASGVGTGIIRPVAPKADDVPQNIDSRDNSVPIRSAAPTRLSSEYVCSPSKEEIFTPPCDVSCSRAGNSSSGTASTESISSHKIHGKVVDTSSDVACHGEMLLRRTSPLHKWVPPALVIRLLSNMALVVFLLPYRGALLLGLLAPRPAASVKSATAIVLPRAGLLTSIALTAMSLRLECTLCGLFT